MRLEPSSPTPGPASGTERIEVRVGDLKQLFNSMDPSPFKERDLDPGAAEFIVSWAREVPRKAPLALVIHVDRQAGANLEGTLGTAINEFFHYRADMTRRRLRELFRVGRLSLAIGLLALASAYGIVRLLGSVFDDVGIGGLLREGVIIGGWVAMWRPLEIFLYDWWPIRREAQLYDRLGAMPVQVVAEGRSE